MNTSKTIVHQMAVDAWGAGAVVLTLCLILEAAERGFVSRQVNILWILLFVVAATLAVMATHPGAAHPEPHRPARNASALISLVALLAAVAAWVLLPRELSIVWRAAASGTIFVAALSVRAAFAKKGVNHETDDDD